MDLTSSYHFGPALMPASLSRGPENSHSSLATRGPDQHRSTNKDVGLVSTFLVGQSRLQLCMSSKGPEAGA